MGFSSLRRLWLLACLVGVVAFGCGPGSAFAAFPGLNGKIAFEDGGVIATMNPDGSGLTLLTGGSDPSWSADGRRIAFVCTPCAGTPAGDLWLMNADGSNFHSLGVAGFSPSWSPDNDHIAFQQGRSIMMVSASSATVTTFLQGLPGGESYSQPAWSPDGSTIAVTDTFPAVAGVARQSVIAVIPAAGGLPRALTSSSAPGVQDAAADWSPDGSMLVFSHSTPATGPVLEEILLSRGVITALPANHDSWSDPAFSPDGRLVAATSALLSVDVWTMAAGGGAFARLTSVDGAHRADWQPQPGPTNTPTGPSIDVQPANQAGSSPVDVFYDQVLVAGNTTLTTGSSGPPVPSGFSLGSPPTYYNLHTTAQYTTATVCITDPNVTASSVLLHWDASGVPTDVTDRTLPNNPDPVLHSICSDLLTSFSPFAVAQTQTADTTPPAISLSHSADGQNGWNLSAPVSVAVNASDPDGGLAGPPSCTDAANGAAPAPITVGGSEPNFAVSVSGEGVHALSCTASDPASNTASASDTVKIDTRAPLVSYTGASPSYTVAQTVSISCSATDPTPGSGLASTSCANINRPAYSFPVGTTTLSADATDNAGNTGHGMVSFSVQVTPGSLCLVTKQFVESLAKFASLPQWLKTAIDAKLVDLCTALSTTTFTLSRQTKAQAIAAYDKGITFLAGLGWLTGDQATTLTRLAGAL